MISCMHFVCVMFFSCLSFLSSRIVSVFLLEFLVIVIVQNHKRGQTCVVQGGHRH